MIIDIFFSYSEPPSSTPSRCQKTPIPQSNSDVCQIRTNVMDFFPGRIYMSKTLTVRAMVPLRVNIPTFT